VAEFLADSARYLLLATEQDRVLGSLNGYALRHLYRREPQFLLYEIDVRPECRNRGIRKALVESFMEVWVLTDEANPAALKMYTACGLRRQGRDQMLLNQIFHRGVPASP
jgi:GNAT superfamily N-acetyltransferase